MDKLLAPTFWDVEFPFGRMMTAQKMPQWESNEAPLRAGNATFGQADRLWQSQVLSFSPNSAAG